MVERKVAARVQDRLGPNRVGPFGLLQSVADAVKMLTKEDITPLGADKFIYNLAPIIAFAAVVLIWAVIPFTPLHIGADLSIGILYFVAVGSIGTVKIMMAGWASNNKYALLGAFRTIAQLLELRSAAGAVAAHSGDDCWHDEYAGYGRGAGRHVVLLHGSGGGNHVLHR